MSKVSRKELVAAYTVPTTLSNRQILSLQQFGFVRMAFLEKGPDEDVTPKPLAAFLVSAQDAMSIRNVLLEMFPIHAPKVEEPASADKPLGENSLPDSTE